MLAIVTGAGSGLGLAVHEALLRHGTECISIARSKAKHDPGRHIIADFAQQQDWPALVGPILRDLSFSRLVLFDIAAVLPQGSCLSVDFEAKMDLAMRVNVLMPQALGRSLAEVARSRGARLDIVHVSSGAALRPIPRWGAYCASKAAAASAWRVFEVENAFATAQIYQPGVIATKMQAGLRAQNDPNAAEEASLRDPNEVAHDLLFQAEIMP